MALARAGGAGPREYCIIRDELGPAAAASYFAAGDLRPEQRPSSRAQDRPRLTTLSRAELHLGQLVARGEVTYPQYPPPAAHSLCRGAYSDGATGLREMCPEKAHIM